MVFYVSILDQLIEKKDLKIYAQLRIKVLEKNLGECTRIMPEKKRELAKRLILGRISELKRLLLVLHELKKEGKKEYRMLALKQEEK
jgi:hypothetical protein